MIGAIIGDIAGSRFEFNNYRKKDFELFTPECSPTDDSIMTVALGKAILSCNGDYTNLSQKAIECMQEFGKRYPPLRLWRYVQTVDTRGKPSAIW